MVLLHSKPRGSPRCKWFPQGIYLLGFLFHRMAVSSSYTFHPSYGHRPAPGEAICVVGADASDVAVSVITGDKPRSPQIQFDILSCPSMYLRAHTCPSDHQHEKHSLLHPQPPSSCISLLSSQKEEGRARYQARIMLLYKGSDFAPFLAKLCLPVELW